MSNRDLDLVALRLDAARQNGGGTESGLRRHLDAREAHLDARTAQLAQDRATLRRERKALRTEARLVILAWGLLLLTTCALGAGWPTVLAWADLLWRR